MTATSSSTASLPRAQRGPEYTFSEAISFQVSCETQEEVDQYWRRCPRAARRARAVAQGPLRALVAGRADRADGAADRPGPGDAQRVMRGDVKMRKIDIAELERAAGQPVGA